ncbi:hypothetical protein [Chitinimonas sp.]|uniref:hypothetical protein n=1 Tax=Chitinimonas sp. TaxID=1934313 RepID=UPI0035B2EF98
MMHGRRPFRIRVQPRWVDESEPPRYRPPRPGMPQKALAVFGMVLFWMHYLGWMGEGGEEGLEAGFWLFAVLQLPLLWSWLRYQRGR